jgi:hypothetical protein
MNKDTWVQHIGTVESITAKSITFVEDATDCSITIRTDEPLPNEFWVGDKIYYAYIASKKPLGINSLQKQQNYNDWYDPDTHPDIVD